MLISTEFAKPSARCTHHERMDNVGYCCLTQLRFLAKIIQTTVLQKRLDVQHLQKELAPLICTQLKLMHDKFEEEEIRENVMRYMHRWARSNL